MIHINLNPYSLYLLQKTASKSISFKHLTSDNFILCKDVVCGVIPM